MSKRILDWLHNHPWTVVSFLIGTNIGVLLFHFVSGRDTAGAWATLLGAVVGSMVAVFGAIWASQANLRRDLRALRQGVLTIVSPLRDLADNSRQLLAAAEGSKGPLSAGDFGALKHLRVAADHTLGSMNEIRDAFAIRPLDRIVYYQIISSLENFLKACDNQFLNNENWVEYRAALAQANSNAAPIPPEPDVVKFGRIWRQIDVISDVVRNVGI
ncbi:hypothetical protein M8R20_32320 [Pseudomonas sp. R2.Fl]|nr:hypothetical protein [Pseudomonas sp. R2.Fl]